jgi:hypothetical protein
MTTEDETQYVHSGGTVPIFSGTRADYETWREDVDDWEISTKLKPEQQAARLTYVQIDLVKKVMRKVPKAKRNSSEGLALVLKEMEKEFKKDPALVSRPTFAKWDNMRRQKDETTEQFILKFDLTFHELQKHDIEVQCSDRLLALKALDRLEIAPEHATQILTAIQGPLTTRAIVDAVESLFKTDVPWSPQSSTPLLKKPIPDSESAQALVHDEMLDDSDPADASYWSKGKGKGFPKHVVCLRCGLPKHKSPACPLSWPEAQKSLKANPISAPRAELAMASFACTTCNHPACEGEDASSTDSPAWEYDDDIDA